MTQSALYTTKILLPWSKFPFLDFRLLSVFFSLRIFSIIRLINSINMSVQYLHQLAMSCSCALKSQWMLSTHESMKISDTCCKIIGIGDLLLVKTELCWQIKCIYSLDSWHFISEKISKASVETVKGHSDYCSWLYSFLYSLTTQDTRISFESILLFTCVFFFLEGGVLHMKLASNLKYFLFCSKLNIFVFVSMHVKIKISIIIVVTIVIIL